MHGTPPDETGAACYAPLADSATPATLAGVNTPTHDQQAERARHLLDILELEPIEQNLYRGRNEVRGPFRLFGGQVLAQALRAAGRTVEGRDAHSLRAYFIRPGDAARPVLYEVERIRDGSSFATRRVVAIQQGEAIFSMDVSFQVTEAGFEHAHRMPNVPPPEELEDDIAVVAGLTERPPGLSPMAGRARPFEMRSVFPLGSAASTTNRFWNPVWIRFCADLPGDDQALARCLLAYASDMGLVSTGALPHAEAVPREQIMMASLDHALWFHRNVPLDDWILFHKRTSTASGARALVHAEFFARDGTLVASATQEGLLRVAEPRTVQ
ncbi:MAG: acyl-CoA thioesterase II [Pseudomonadales bacterium]|nr:acyl-CoA thioesterase II [Pseudomonadales bacterium]